MTLQHDYHNAQNIAPSHMQSPSMGKHSDGLAAPPSLVNASHPGASLSSDSGSSPSPETVMSSTGVPNPFARMTAPTMSAPAPVHNSVNTHTSGMTSVNWGAQPSSAPIPQQTQSAPLSVPNPFQTNKPAVNGFVIASSGIRLHSGVAPAPQRLTSSGNAPSPVRRYENSSNTANGNNTNSNAEGSPESGKTGTGLNHRRQKRLERNRESARLSRRRRKQYLEILEERVKNLSVEMDKGRRHHVAIAIDTVKQKKEQALADPSALTALETTLNSTSLELRVASTFQIQQVRSLSLPPHVKFLLWLSLQNDAYFRGGRAASERLSAARIGERMLSSGNDRVPPAHGMWPLFCNEVSLSYDQEEKVRAFQKTLLTSNESWLHRHTGASSNLVVQSAHDCIQSLSSNIGQRQRSVTNCLNTEQRRKLLSWSNKNTDRIAVARKGKSETRQRDLNDGFKLAGEQHDAANLYILNHRLQNILSGMPKPAVLVNPANLRRFSRRPSFESLGSSMAMDKNDGEGGLNRESSFSSTGSLKRSASELSVGEEDRTHISCIPPEEAEATAMPAIEAVLGFVKHIIPKPPTPPVVTSVVKPVFAMPPPPAKTHHHIHVAPHSVSSAVPAAPPQVHQILPANGGYGVAHHPHQQMMASAPMPHTVQHMQVQQQQPLQPHPFIPAFLPPHLNVVPEEGFLPQNAVDDFLFDLAEEDWAIGEGFEMDIHS